MSIDLAKVLVQDYLDRYPAPKVMILDITICCGVALLLAAQVFINIGVNAGLLPTKGLTLPFLSYGGSSMLVLFAMMGLILRIEYELRVAPGTALAAWRLRNG